PTRVMAGQRDRDGRISEMEVRMVIGGLRGLADTVREGEPGGDVAGGVGDVQGALGVTRLRQRGAGELVGGEGLLGIVHVRQPAIAQRPGKGHRPHHRPIVSGGYLPVRGERPPPMIRLSSSFVRTLREDPADAEVASHKLLVRAGYIRRSAPGVYTWLPLGLKVLRKIEQIVREEQDAIGGQEVLFSALQPREPYETTGRWGDFPGMFRLQDRKQDDYLLAPTHEEMFTLAVKDLFSSY